MPDRFLVHRDDGSCGLVSLPPYPEVVSGNPDVIVTPTTDPVTGQVTYEIGANFTVDINVQSVNYDDASNVLTIVETDGTIHTVDLTDLEDTVTTLVANPDGSHTYTSEDGTITVIPAGAVSSITQVVTSGNVIATHDNGDGTSTDIIETNTTMVDNGDGTITYTSENGTPFTFTVLVPDPLPDPTASLGVEKVGNDFQLDIDSLPDGDPTICNSLIAVDQGGVDVKLPYRPEPCAIGYSNTTINGATSSNNRLTGVNVTAGGFVNGGPIASAVITNPDPCRAAIVDFHILAQTALGGQLGPSAGVSSRYLFDNGNGALAIWYSGSSVQFSHDGTSNPMEGQRHDAIHNQVFSNVIPAGGSIIIRGQAVFSISSGNLNLANQNINPDGIAINQGLNVRYRLTTLNECA